MTNMTNMAISVVSFIILYDYFHTLRLIVRTTHIAYIYLMTTINNDEEVGVYMRSF